MRAPLERRPLADGEQGIEQTRREIMRLITEGSADLEIIQEARRATLNVRPHDTTGEIAAIFDYVTGLRSPYRFDPVGKEMLQAATHTSLGRDCDCFVVWAGSLLQAIGHPVRVVIGAKRRPAMGTPAWSHTWLEVFDLRRRGWVAFDPVLHLRAPGQLAAVGDVAPHAVLWRSAAVSGYENLSGARLGGLDGFSLKKLAKGVAKVGKTLSTGVVGGVLKRVVSVVPGGQAALTAIDVATKAVGVVKAVKKGGIGKGLATVVRVAAPALIGGGKLGSGLKSGLATLNTASAAAKKVRAAVKLPTTRAPTFKKAVAAVRPAPRPTPKPALRAPAPRVLRPALSSLKKALPTVAAAAAAAGAVASIARKPLNVADLPARLQRMIAPGRQEAEASPEDETDLLEEQEPEQLQEEDGEDLQDEGPEDAAEEDADFSEPGDDEATEMEAEE